MEADVVVGFSMGASVALEMVTSGGFAGPAVLLGISLSAKDEPAFFRAIVRLGSLPVTALAKGAASMVKRIPVSAERQAEMREDLRRNDPQHLRHALDEYLANVHLVTIPGNVFFLPNEVPERIAGTILEAARERVSAP